MRCTTAMVAAGWWTLASSYAVAGPADNLVEDVGRGLLVDWSTLMVEVEAGSYRAGAQATKAVEQSARLAIDDRLDAGLGVVRVAPGVLVEDLLGEEDLSGSLEARRSRWRVSEATYTVSGKVDLRAQLSLQEFLKPFTLKRARPTPPHGEASPHTGVLIDARGLGARPAYLPALLGPDGAPLWQGEMWDEDAVSAAPVVWVPDPAHPAAARAGDRPLLLTATSASGAEITLGAAAAAALRALLDAEAVARGRVVIVSDPL